MKKITVYLAGVVVAGVLAGNQGQALAADGTTPVLPGILLNEDDDGMVRDAMVGDYLLICLADPWGGAYGWEIMEISGDGALREIGRSQHMPGPGDWSWGQDHGQPDTAYFRWVADSVGQTTVSLVCLPPPGIMAPVQLYEVTVNVWP